MSAEHEPGVYVKGDKTRVVTTVGDAVQAVFEGYTRQGAVPLAVEQALSEDGGESTPEYRKLQERAKVLGIAANQSSAALQEQIAAKEGEGA